ncbi:MAG: hypothetical protein HY900_22995 [Deltaproteobacteria bacterium]|nr:hypothetical protein [Deltaproteobacteria bacterium]
MRVLSSVAGPIDRAEPEASCAFLSRRVFEAARVPVEQVHVAELTDSTAFAELEALEALGLCPRGRSGAFTASGATALGGRIPVNTGGGLAGRGHVPGITGLAQMHDVVVQLRGEARQRQVQAARIGLVATAEDEAGSMTLHLLARP